MHHLKQPAFEYSHFHEKQIIIFFLALYHVLLCYWYVNKHSKYEK